jgi:hypothetical protein
MDAEVKAVLRDLYGALSELTKIAKINCQTVNPTFAESTIAEVMKPTVTILEGLKKRLA